MVVYVTYGNILDDTSYELVNKYCHEWWLSSSISQNLTFLLLSTTSDEILSCMIWDSYEKALSKWQ